MKSLILICVVLTMSFLQTSEACSSKSGEHPSSLKDPARSQAEPTGPKPPPPEMPTVTGCMEAGFPGSPEYNKCMEKFHKDMAKWTQDLQAWNSKYGEKDEDGEFAHNSILSNGWRVRAEGGETSLNSINGATKITVTPNGSVDQVKGEFKGKNTMQWALMHDGKQVGWVKVRPPADIDANKLKSQYSGGALTIWRE